MVGKNKFFVWAVVFAIILCAVFLFLPKTGLVVQSIESDNLEELRMKAQVECLQNSQCELNQECVDNSCVDRGKIDNCQKVDLSTSVIKLKPGMKINSAKRVLTRGDLPYLLSNGEIDEIVDGNLTKHLYTSAIILGENRILEESGNYFIEKKEAPTFIYTIYFSSSVDFSNKNIQGQAIKIFGDEYFIGGNSDNNFIDLNSGNGKVSLDETKNVNIKKDENGKVMSIEIPFYLENDLQSGKVIADSVFNSVEISLNYADEKTANVNFGGVCR